MGGPGIWMRGTKTFAAIKVENFLKLIEESRIALTLADGFGHRRAWTFPCGMHFVLPEARCSRNNFHNSALHVALVPQSVSEDSNGGAGAETAPHRAGAAIVAT